MSEIEEKLNNLEEIIRRFNEADEIIFMLLTVNERGRTTGDDLAKVGNIVRKLNDESLSKIYSKIFEGSKVSGLYQPIHPQDYFSFIERLGALLIEATIQANNADIALRKALALDSLTGIWGSKEWCPSGQL